MTSSRAMSVVGGYPLQGADLRHYDAFYGKGVAEAAQHESRYASALTVADGEAAICPSRTSCPSWAGPAAAVVGRAEVAELLGKAEGLNSVPALAPPATARVPARLERAATGQHASPSSGYFAPLSSTAVPGDGTPPPHSRTRFPHCRQTTNVHRRNRFRFGARKPRSGPPAPLVTGR